LSEEDEEDVYIDYKGRVSLTLPKPQPVAVTTTKEEYLARIPTNEPRFIPMECPELNNHTSGAFCVWCNGRGKVFKQYASHVPKMGWTIDSHNGLKVVWVPLKKYLSRGGSTAADGTVTALALSRRLDKHIPVMGDEIEVRGKVYRVDSVELVKSKRTQHIRVEVTLLGDG